MATNPKKAVGILCKLLVFFYYSISLSNCVLNEDYPAKLDLIPGKVSYEKNYIHYYMYNITNPDAFENGKKPILEEVGPYVYKETRRKFNVSNLTNSVIKYTVDRSWEFMPELSEGHSESDELNIINIPMIILATKLSAKRLPKAFNDILVEELTDKNETLVRRKEQVGNIFFHGMNVSVYTEILADILQGNVPPEFEGGKFSLFKNQNGTVEGNFTVQTKGAGIGDILSFNDKTKLNYWSGNFCNKIDGTDGYFFRPGIKKESTLKIFYPELCRSVVLEWKGEIDYKGIHVSKFSFPKDMLESAQIKTENKCFCSKSLVPSNDSLDGCLKKGFIDYSSCKQDSPLLVSFPHFLYADEEYKEKIGGMNPMPDKHETEFLIEPKTGAILSGKRKFQFNVKLRPLDNVEIFRNMTFMIFPVFITERSIIPPENLFNKVKLDVKNFELKYIENNKGLDMNVTYPKQYNDTNPRNILSDQPANDEKENPKPTPEEKTTKTLVKSKSQVNRAALNGPNASFSLCLNIYLYLILITLFSTHVQLC